MTDINDMERIDELRASEKEERRAWDQLPNEPTKEHDLFQRFLVQGPKRKVTKVARMEDVTENVGTLYRYSRRWRWKERAAYWDRDRARRIDDVMFWHEYETRLRNLEKLEAAVVKLLDNIHAAHVDKISREMALSMLGRNTALLNRVMQMEERLLRLGRRDFCPFCRMRRLSGHGP
ncbi:MAG: hypothetical protein OXO48_12735 [Caldilineaceae bacterium]|nr:hypothetical protein [Caldilineaceae bacterium]